MGNPGNRVNCLEASYCTMIVQPRDDGALEGRDSVWWVPPAGGSKGILAGWGGVRWGGTEGVKDGLIHLLIRPQKLAGDSEMTALPFRGYNRNPFVERASHPTKVKVQLVFPVYTPSPNRTAGSPLASFFS